jgi:hypothetical protein
MRLFSRLIFNDPRRPSGLWLIWPWLAVSLCLAWFNTCPAVAAEAQLSMGDLDAQVRDVSHDIEDLRRYMGAPAAQRLNIVISHVSPHDLFFQALAMYEKTYRLTFEILRIKGRKVTAAEDGELTIKTLPVLIQDTHKSILSIMKEFDLPAQASAGHAAGDITPAQVFAEMQGVNRQLNLLLERPYSPSDAYEKITLAVGYAARLLSAYPQAERIPPEPSLEPEKQPRDVYLRLMECMHLLSAIYRKVGLDALEVDVSGIQPDKITPSDVFDLSALVVARLDYLHKRFGIKQMPWPEFYPGRRFPSDVYQRAGLLQKQLVSLNALVEARGRPLP